MKPPFEAYTGNMPYLFISYAHKDSKLVYPLITAWHNAGYRVWYDEGIDPGNEWPEEIAAALKVCRQFIVFITPRAVASKNVKNEINFALNLDKDFIAIYLEETTLPSGLELRMGDIQAIMKYRMEDSMFENKMNKSLKKTIKRAKNEPVNPVHEDSAEEQKAVDDGPKLPEREDLKDHPRIKFIAEFATDVANTIKETKKSAASGANWKEELKKNFEAKKPLYEKSWKKFGADIDARKLQREKERLERKKNRKPGEPRPNVTVKKGVLSSLISFAIMGGIIYFVYFYVINRYSTLKKEYLKIECVSYLNRDQKLAFIEKNEKISDKDLKMVQMEEELTRCRNNTPEQLQMKKLGIDTMSIENLEKLYAERKDKVDSWKKNLVLEYQSKYKESLKNKIDSTNSEFMKKSVADLYRTLLVDLIRESYKEKQW
jgi:hypothetical protein